MLDSKQIFSLKFPRDSDDDVVFVSESLGEPSKVNPSCVKSENLERSPTLSDEEMECFTSR